MDATDDAVDHTIGRSVCILMISIECIHRYLDVFPIFHQISGSICVECTYSTRGMDDDGWMSEVR